MLPRITKSHDWLGRGNWYQIRHEAPYGKGLENTNGQSDLESRDVLKIIKLKIYRGTFFFFIRKYE